MSWFYMSFADADLPKGQQFLGACYVEAPTLKDAITRTHLEGFNPGGEIQVLGPLPEDDLEEHVTSEDRNRLLSREEINAL